MIEFLKRKLGHRATPHLAISPISTYDEYLEYSARTAADRKARLAVERDLATSKSSFTVSGYCFVCRKTNNFHVDYSYSYTVDAELLPNWREHLKCPGCNLNNRMRAAIHILHQVCMVRPSSRLYITEQLTPLFQAIRARYPNSIGSEYMGSALPFGAITERGLRNETIANLTFPAKCFDQILTFDVLEHVPDYARGFAEFFRCLKPGGTLLFSVPFTKEPNTTVRAQANSDGTVSHLFPPEYHGDPLSNQGCLCFYHFGWDVLEAPRQIGFQDVSALFFWSREYGYIGNGDQYLFMARKPV